MQKQRMRVPAASAKLQWKTMVVDDPDPLVFAQRLQAALQEVSDGNYTINSQMVRGSAHVIVASRVEMEPHLPAETQPPEPFRRRVVEAPTARQQGATSEEVLYHFIQNGRQEQRAFPGLVDALRLVHQHLQQRDDVLPVNITTLTMTRFDPEAFPMLLKMFAEDLQCPPG